MRTRFSTASYFFFFFVTFFLRSFFYQGRILNERKGGKCTYVFVQIVLTAAIKFLQHGNIS